MFIHLFILIQEKTLLGEKVVSGIQHNSKIHDQYLKIFKPLTLTPTATIDLTLTITCIWSLGFMVNLKN